MSSMLRITEAFSIGIHACALLASNPGKSIPVSELAKTLHASKAHLHKVMTKLAKTGIVKSAKGATGGYRLCRKPENVTLMEMYRVIEGRYKRISCLSSHEKICQGENCVLAELVGKIDNEIFDYLSKTPLAKIAFDPDKKGQAR